MRKLTGATRAGRLAVRQTDIVTEALRRSCAGLDIDIMQVSTSGDKDRQTALWELKGSGFFTSQLEQVLLHGQADFAVHSLKDLPVKQPEGLELAAICFRDYPEDCLLSNTGISDIKKLPVGAKVGTSSLRRASQIRRMHRDIEVSAIRGNVPTRIEKLRQGDYDAIMLARAGLERLTLMDKAAVCFSPKEFIPAPGQGALAVQVRSDDTEARDIISAIDNQRDRITVQAERQILTVLQCGCHAPVGAYAAIDHSRIEITAFVGDIEGGRFIKKSTAGAVENWEELSEALGNELLDNGGSEILSELER